ncbi:helix-turn-helix domain-containing protein [Ochrobactrum sp. Sa2BUA5]|uniref:Helix-turn-helix domain-containing protein n=2 Tax=Ochrobactrum quorumnocens TaxID=271865 RepID=A0A5N1K8W1_9HYPH|nr:helix-turn-helix domain-containing protein [[Ochrobactrum] quorumnocens]MBD7990276.1 helix-turn-helix domain-containing protein [Ochrobactrum gallinarum]
MAVAPLIFDPKSPYRAPCGVCVDCDVRRMAVCSALDDGDLGALEAIMTSKKLDANEMLVEEGDPKRRVFSLTSGMLRIYTSLPDGRRQIAGFLVPGDYLGLADDDVYSQSAEAVVPSVLCAFSSKEMEALMVSFPKLRERLHQMTREALRTARDNQLVLGRLAPVEKLASFLLVLAARAEKRGDKANLVHLAMNRTDIADYLGLTIETVSRSFTKLKTQGLIQLLDANTVEILSRRSLAAVAGMDIEAI